MKSYFDTYRPEGFSTVTPYLFAEDPARLIDFLTHGLRAEELQRTKDPESGTINNCILKLGSSCFMIGKARPPFSGMRASFYLYVRDVDEMHKLAVSEGAKEIMAPADMDYNDRQSGIQDPEGNYWWISKRLVEKAYDD
ncbi:VOC family protein [Muriicola marianensis]|uniref:Glyoxalase n=1 Tax=Muriicola marianensis TaxID=1324801 RepID=A0ABQ1QU87_9FLAO|nr:VOC family protein [Muriicola marianensis]GGD42601.1 glyoxalase [Muriicola marianensis]